MTFKNVVPFDNWETTYSDYTPFGLAITGITNATQAVITYGTAHPYTVGEYLSFRVSSPYGMTEMNNLRGKVLAVTSLTVTVDVNTKNFTPFVYPPVGIVEVPAQSVPAGSGVVPNEQPAQTNLLDVFDNQPLNG